MNTKMIFRKKALLLLSALIFFVGMESCFRPKENDVEYRSMRERLDEAVRLQFDADSCDSAMMMYSDVVSSYRPGMTPQEKSLVVEGLNRMWFVYYFVLFDYADAAECLERGLDICDTDTTIESSRLYLNKGITYSLLTIRQREPSEKIFELADVNLREAHRRAVRSGNVNVADYALLNMIVLYDKASRPVCELNSMLRQTLSLHDGSCDSECRFADALLGIVRNLQAEDYENVVVKVDSFLASNSFEADEIRNKYQLLLYKARALTGCGRPEEAVCLLDSIMNEAEELGLSDVMIPVYELKADAYGKSGDLYESSLQRLAYYERRDLQLSEESVMAVKELPLIHHLRKYEHTLALESHRRKAVSIYALYTTLIVILLISAGVIIVRKNRKLKIANQVLFRRNEEQLRLFEGRIGSREGSDDSIESDNAAGVCLAPAVSSDVIMDEEDAGELPVIYRRVAEAVECGRLWRDSSLTITRLAVRMDIGEKQLSRAVHCCSGMNFSSFINRYRVMEASGMLGNDKDFGHLSIQGIAETVGFKSRTSFIAAFKQFVGMLPSAYRKMSVVNSDGADNQD